MSNEIDGKLFKQILGQTLIKLANKLINTTNKEENQIIVKNINKNKDKIYEMDSFDNFVIQSGNLRTDLKYTIDLISNFNETIQFIWFKNIKIKKWTNDFNWGKQSKFIRHFM